LIVAAGDTCDETPETVFMGSAAECSSTTALLATGLTVYTGDRSAGSAMEGNNKEGEDGTDDGELEHKEWPDLISPAAKSWV
jgi:hypothetical protein